MFRNGTTAPDIVPVLSQGKHRNPKKGACFMELASYLAGERWSDRPACTHPLLASLARLVNDHMSDAGRQRLVGLVPSVIGTSSDDPRIDVDLALRCATTALPIASADRQRILAVAVLAAERVRATLEGTEPGGTSAASRAALVAAPAAAEWAHRYAVDLDTTPEGFRRYGAPTVVRLAVVGIAQACIADPDAVLHDLLVSAIDDVTQRQPAPVVRLATTSPASTPPVPAHP